MGKYYAASKSSSCYPQTPTSFLQKQQQLLLQLLQLQLTNYLLLNRYTLLQGKAHENGIHATSKIIRPPCLHSRRLPSLLHFLSAPTTQRCLQHRQRLLQQNYERTWKTRSGRSRKR